MNKKYRKELMRRVMREIAAIQCAHATKRDVKNVKHILKYIINESFDQGYLARSVERDNKE